MSDSIRLVVAGVALGVPLALMVQRSAESLAYGVRVDRFDAPVFAAVLLLTVAVAAALLPAQRASRVDPAIALRVD